MNRDWLAPLTGVLFIVFAIAAIAISGEPPSADDPVQDIVDHYVDNKDQIVISAMLGGLAMVALVFFGSYLRNALRPADGSRSVFPAVLFAGTVVMATGLAIDTTIGIALAEAAEDIDPAAVQALQALWDNDFIPIALGIELFLLAAGLSIIKNGGLPKWLGWVAVVLALVGLTPLGFVAFLGGAVWILIASIMLVLRERKAAGGGGEAGPPAARTDPV